MSVSPPEFDPVLQSVAYKVNKKLFDHYESTSPLSVREALNELVTKKEGKLSVTIKTRTV